MEDKSVSHRVADFIATHTGASAITVTGFTKLSGGAIQSNYALSVELSDGNCPGAYTFVIRSDAPSTLSASLTREQEFAVLKCAHAAGVTTPEPLWLCTDSTVIGQPFCIMRKVSGTANGRQLVKSGMTDSQSSALVRRLGHELACLHRIRPENTDLPFLTIPQPVAALARINTYRAALDDISEPHPVLEWALNWLEDHMPSPLPVSLCHCDFRTGNYMVDNGQLTGILDWEFAAWSDPYEDLGWLCAKSWRFGNVSRQVGGLGDKVDLFFGYASATGRPVETERVEYWEIMAMVRWAVIALQQAQRHLSGEETSLELALTGRMVPEMEFDVLNQCQSMERTYG